MLRISQVVIPNNGNPYFGHNIQAHTDFNGDGFDDMAIESGPPLGYPPGMYSNIYFGGNPMDTIVDIVVRYPDFADGTIKGGDFNRDHFGDYIIGPWRGYQVLYGGASPPASQADFGPTHYEWAGSCIVGDYNGDGADDVVTTGDTIRYLRHPHPDGVSLWQSIQQTAQTQQIVLLWPNPATDGRLHYRFTLPWKGHLLAELYREDGLRLGRWFNPDVLPGILESEWHGNYDYGSRIPPGRYFLKVRYNRLFNSLKITHAADDPLEFIIPIIWKPQ